MCGERAHSMKRETYPIEKRAESVQKELILYRRSSFCGERAHSMKREPYLVEQELILYRKSSFCREGAHCVERKLIL